MWRSLFVALGISSVCLGGECLVIDGAVLAQRGSASPALPAREGGTPAAARKRDVVPPDWAPWSLMSAGAVVVLYSFTLPRRAG